MKGTRNGEQDKEGSRKIPEMPGDMRDRRGHRVREPPRTANEGNCYDKRNNPGERADAHKKKRHDAFFAGHLFWGEIHCDAGKDQDRTRSKGRNINDTGSPLRVPKSRRSPLPQKER